VYDYAAFFQGFLRSFFLPAGLPGWRVEVNPFTPPAVLPASLQELRPMSLTRHDVENIAHLARLAISEQQLPVYVDSLSKIFNFVEQLNAADTASVEPMAHPLGDQVQRLRPDEVLDVDNHAKYQRNAPRVEAELYLVPKVIE
jgi:aspartyl-tRNA(Asn)/glutamyl-tRNA(Gln) amidotransferase subunit C